MPVKSKTLRKRKPVAKFIKKTLRRKTRRKRGG